LSRLSNLRKERGLKQEYVANKCSLNIGTLQKYEQGATNLRKAEADTVYKLAEFYEVSMKYLLN
jgi:transcriptional regulator with XRE-family HTH domain